MRYTQFIFLSLCFFVCANVFSQKTTDFHFYQISTKDGLSQNTVRAILEDKKGFIWAGTLDGINRYDGYQIVNYKPQVGNLNSLEDHRIKDVYQDRNGYLWIKTYHNSFSCYDPVADTFIDYYPEGKEKSTLLYQNYHEALNNDIWLWGNSQGCLRIRYGNGKFSSRSFLDEEESDRETTCGFLFEDSKSSIWVGGSSGLYRITGEHTEIFFKNGTEKRTFTNAIELNNKIFFVTEESSVIEYDLKSRLFHEIKYDLNKTLFLDVVQYSHNDLLIISRTSGLISYNISSRQFTKPEWAKDDDLKGTIEFIIDKNKGIWVYNYTGLVWYYNPENKRIKKMSLIPSEIMKTIDYERYNVFIDSSGLIWITTYGNGLFCYDPETDILNNYRYTPNQNSPASNYFLSITEDRYGNIWIGSEYAGIIKVTRSNYDIKIIRPEPDTAIGKNNNVRTICEASNSNIWIGTKNGNLYVYDESLNSGKTIIKDINPYSILEDKQLRMWIGTKGSGLYVINAVDHSLIAQFSHDKNKKTGLSGNSIFTTLQDTKGRIWLGSFGNGINLVEEEGGETTFKHFFNNQGNRSYVRYLYQDSKGMIWACTSDGIIRFNPDSLINDATVYTVYKFNLNDKNSLRGNDIKTVYEDNSGQIWVGTAGGGLNLFVEANEDQKEYFVSYSKDDGLSGDIITGILEDYHENLWISSENGITKFDKNNSSFTTYHFSDITYGNHFNENSNLYLRNGNMLWGSLDGLLVFNPDHFIPEENTPTVTLTDFFIYNQKIKAGEKDSPLTRSISYSDKIELNYKQNNFTIEFATLTLKDPEKNKYTYKLQDYDKHWSAVSHINTATYKNIPPGKYVFMVRGSNSDGIWNGQTTEIEIIVSPPFWRSTIAYICYFLLLVILSIVATRLIKKFYTLNKSVEIEKQLTNHKLRFFTNISHEFRTPLTLIRGAVENLHDQTDVPERIKKQINVLSRNSSILTRLIDQLLEFRKLQNNILRLDLEETDIIKFVKEIYSSFQEVAQQKQIEFTFSSKANYYNMYIDQRKVDKIIYNLISNAFKFTPKGGKIEVEISLNSENHTCLISVKDNGIGISREKQYLLFSRFMQINFSSSGTGVGLSLVKEFVDVHKGKVWYEENKGSKGSVFNVELSTKKETYKGENFIQNNSKSDLIENSTENVPAPAEEIIDIHLLNIDDSTLSNYKMLIIDDNDDIRNFLIDEFSKYFMVDSAENGREGLGKAITTNPDLIICDVMMPEMDGFEVTRRLKEEFQTSHIPIILLTAHSSLEHQLEGIESGADAYIMKPFSLKYLVTRVFKLIEQREQLKKRFTNEFTDKELVSTNDKDKEFYELINGILEEHYTDFTFSVDKFAELSKLKRTIFYKKVKGVTGFSPNELLKIKRLKKAAELLLESELTVSEVSYKVGFEDPFYFSKCFKAQYNCSPSKYGQQ